MSDNIFFYTNNICESFNRSLNSQYIGKTKTIFHFKSAIKNLIEIYNVKNIYQEKKLSTSRALAYYTKRNNIIHLINLKDMEKIKNSYKEYLKKNKIPFIDNNYDSDEDENYEKLKEKGYNSESDTEEEKEEDENFSYNIDNDDEDDNDDNDGQDGDGAENKDFDNNKINDNNSDNEKTKYKQAGNNKKKNYNSKKNSKKNSHLLNDYIKEIDYDENNIKTEGNFSIQSNNNNFNFLRKEKCVENIFGSSSNFSSNDNDFYYKVFNLKNYENYQELLTL